MKLVVDASCAVEYLLRTSVGRSLDETFRVGDLYAPELIDAEVLSVLRREVRLKRLSTARAKEALEDLFAWDLERLSHRPLLYVAWSFRDRVSAYDALYVASAKLHGAALVTADGPLSRTPGLDIVIQNVRLQ